MMTVKGSGGGVPPVDAEKQHQREAPPAEAVRCSDEFLQRPSWTDARLALRQVNKVSCRIRMKSEFVVGLLEKVGSSVRDENLIIVHFWPRNKGN